MAQLHSALLVLIQHNYVNCYLQSEDANPRRPPISISLYEADLPAILQTLRQGGSPCRLSKQNHDYTHSCLACGYWGKEACYIS